jgi:hypothetical protein
MNGLFSNNVFSGGEPVKVVRSEPSSEASVAGDFVSHRSQEFAGRDNDIAAA